MGSQASKGGVAVEGKAADADPAAAKSNGQVIHLPSATHPHLTNKCFSESCKTTVSDLTITPGVIEKRKGGDLL